MPYPVQLALGAALTTIIALLLTLTRKADTIMAAIDDLESRVSAMESVNQSAITLIAGINEELKAALAANDTDRIKALSDRLGNDTDALAAAVTAGSPAVPDAPMAVAQPNDNSALLTPDAPDVPPTPEDTAAAADVQP